MKKNNEPGLPMTFQKKIILKTLALFLIFVIASLCLLQWRARYLVTDFLSRKIPSHISLSYSDMETNVLSGDIVLKDITLKISNRDTVWNHTFFEAKRLKINRIDYGQLFFNKTIQLESLALGEPVLKYYPFNYFPKEEHAEKGMVNLLKTIFVKKIHIEQGSFYLLKQGKDSIKMAVESYDFLLLEGKTGPKLITKKMPFSFKDYSLEVKGIFVDLGTYETIQASDILISPKRSRLNNVILVSKYDKQELSSHLTVERDFVDFRIPELEIRDLDFGFKSHQFMVRVLEIALNKPSLEMYRDKRLADDSRIKPLYSKLLRELPIYINVANLSIRDGYIAYEEKIEDTKQAGKLYFEHLNTQISNINNTLENEEKTKIKATAEILGQGQMLLEWEFQATDHSDAFVVSGSLKNLESEKLNAFLKPNLRARAKGTIDVMYFNLWGDPKASKGDMKMKYHDFKFEVLDKDRLKINKVLTFIGNLLVNDGSKTDKDGFRFGEIETERDVTKSFFNYLWQNIKSGILDTITGSGKKDA